jgi:HlyD family secretion protein
LFVLLMFVVVLGGFATWRQFTVKADKPNYLLGAIDRGDIVTQVAATGTLAAVTTVAVGTQVSGTIIELYADFNSEVKKGQLLVKLDPELFKTQVDQAQASVNAAEAVLNNDLAAIATTRANIEKAKVDTLDKQRKFKRMKELLDEGIETQDDFDTAQAAQDADVAAQNAVQAQLESNQASYKADQARLVQAQANLKTAQVNLEHTIITSPISGTIISRNVDRGQTVAASFSSPTLFTIGEDLTKMQVSTNIDEADVGKLKTGMNAAFTVDAFQGEVFQAKISQIRLAATTVQNVVTYNAMLDVPNPQLKLKPGMTANVKIVIEQADHALRLPNAALRFRPTMSDSEMAEAFKRAGEEKYYEFSKNAAAAARPAGNGAGAPAGGRGMAMGSAGSGRGGQGGGREAAAARPNRGRRVAVWIMGEDKTLLPVVARLGLTDGVETEITEGKLKEGEKVVVGMELEGNHAIAPAASRPPGFGAPMGGRGMR